MTKNKFKIGFTRDRSEDEQPPAESTPETVAEQLSELITRIWLPCDVFASADMQLTNSQVEEILQENASCEFSRAEMIGAMLGCSFHQHQSGQQLFWLIKRKK